MARRSRTVFCDNEIVIDLDNYRKMRSLKAEMAASILLLSSSVRSSEEITLRLKNRTCDPAPKQTGRELPADLVKEAMDHGHLVGKTIKANQEKQFVYWSQRRVKGQTISFVRVGVFLSKRDVNARIGQEILQIVSARPESHEAERELVSIFRGGARSPKLT